MSTHQDRAFTVGVGMARSSLRRYVMGTIAWATWWSLPALVGLLLKLVFDTITGSAPAGFGVAGLLAILTAVEVARLVIFFGVIATWGRWWAHAQALVRTNMLRAQVLSGDGVSGVPVRGAGKAVAVFRDDVEDLTEYVDSWVDLTGTLGFGTFALLVMFRVDPVITLVVVVPLLVVFLVNRLLADRIRRVRLADREATARVTGFLGDVFSAVLAVKVAGAEDRAIRRLSELNRERRVTSVRDKVLTEGLFAFNGSTVDITIGLVLLLVAGKMRSGSFTVGDLALFTAYLSWMAGVPRWAGTVLARHRHAQVSVRRVARLLPGGDPDEAVRPRPLRLEGAYVPAVLPRENRVAPAAVRLRGFGVVHAGGTGVSAVDLDLAPGSFTVVTGPVGSGKTTLVRGLLGLEPHVTGTVEWDGEVVGDLAGHMTPPRCAYVPQVPRLFSATLRDNLTLGRATADALLDGGVRTAALDGDVADMPAGLDTVVGPRGVRLSGGQLQRAATARALVTDASLLVFDDVSSALDATTEQRLWQRLLAGRDGTSVVPTVLVISHRAAALAHADQVVTMDAGRIIEVRQSVLVPEA
jgi:ATP-binding cassette subfamily B protein